MLARWTTMLLAVAGCDAVFQLDRDEVVEDAPAVDATVDATVLACPPSFHEINGSYYQRVDTLVNWYQAQSACEALRDPALTGHTHLAVFASDSELAAVAGTLSVNLMWIGHHDLPAEGVFVTVTRETVTWPALTRPPWADNQPNNLEDQQHCLIADNQDLLDDKRCDSTTEKYRYVCECDLFESNAPLPP